MRTRTWLVVSGAFLLLTFALLAQVVDWDLWWHLVVGRETVRIGQVPVADFYVYPHLGTESGFHEWGFGVLVYLVERWGGWWALSVVNAAIAAAALVLVAAAAVRRGASWNAALIVLGPLTVLTAYRFCYRPESMLYLAMGATLYALERRWLIALPALCFALSLFHPTALILLLVIGCYAADAMIADRKQGLRVVAALAASVLAVVVAPGGWHGIVLALTASQNEMNALIGEYVPVLSSEYRWHFVAMTLAAVAAVVTIRRRPSDALLVLGFGFLAFRYVRNLTMFGLVIVSPVCMAVDRALRRIPKLRFAAPVVMVGSAAVLVLAPTWGAGEAPGRYPAKTASFILEHRPPGRIFNQLHTGGYLAWRLLPHYEVAIDGRNYYGVNAPLRFVDSVNEIQDGWQRELERHGVSMIATPGTRVGAGRLLPLVTELENDPRWQLALVEPAGMLFVRRDVFPPAVPALPKEAIWHQVLAETQGLDAPRARFSRGVAFFKLHEFPRAAVEFAAYRAAAPEDREAADIAQLLEASVRGDQAATAAVEAMYQSGRSRAQ
jgi:hypothetical protein